MAIRFGTAGNDKLIGTAGNDLFLPGAGDDVMYGGYGNDRFYASAGEDHYYGGNGSDTVTYAANALGVDVNLEDGWGYDMAGGDKYDYYSSIENITGSNHIDVLTGDGNVNHLRGLDGGDIIEGGDGGDILEGGEGSDWLQYEGSDARVVVDLRNNTANGGDATGDVISGFENLYGSNYNDILLGTDGANFINGNEGNDTINGRGGNDRINGEEGNDVLTGGSGYDTFFYQDHFDTGIDRITDFDVHRDTIQYDFLFDGDISDASVSYNVSGYDWFSGTVDVRIEFGDDEGDAVILENLSLADLAYVPDALMLT